VVSGQPTRPSQGRRKYFPVGLTGIVLQGIWTGIPAQVFQMAPFPLMILALVLINLLQYKGVQRWLDDKPGLALLVDKLRGAPPRALGKTFHPD